MQDRILGLNSRSNIKQTLRYTMTSHRMLGPDFSISQACLYAYSVCLAGGGAFKMFTR